MFFERIGNYMKYLLDFICENDGDIVSQSYDVEFFYDENQYGNGTFMSCDNHKEGYADYYFDIRYDRDYHKDEQMQYILNWALNTWNGKDGSYRITDISVKEIADEVR